MTDILELGMAEARAKVEATMAVRELEMELAALKAKAIHTDGPVELVAALFREINRTHKALLAKRRDK